MKRCNGSSRSKVYSKDALRPTDHRFVRELVHELQTELAGFGDHDGRPRHFRDAYNDSPVGPALPAGVREALAALRPTGPRIVANGRNIYKGTRTVGVPVPRWTKRARPSVEQDHRRVKQRVRPMLGFKRFNNAAVTNRWNRTGREVQKGTIQDRQTRWSLCHHGGTLERGRSKPSAGNSMNV